MTAEEQRAASADVAAGLPIGKTFVTQRRTLGEGDFSLLTNLTWTTGESHSAARTDGDGDHRWLSLPVVAAVIVGLAAKHWVSYHLRVEHRVLVLESRELHVTGSVPVRPGDTLRCECELTSVTAQPNGRSAFVDVEERGMNQRGEIVAVVRQRWLVTRQDVD